MAALNSNDKTWITTLPKVGIRPTIDGRYGGVRESLEGQVMAMAENAAKLITLASMLRIPVFMHNVEEGDVYRPSAWSAFGTEGLEGADFRACETYGPIYG